jgi:uncharacterized protein (TIGR02284 family)
MTQDVSAVINDLIETLKDGELGFQAAAEDVTRNDLKRVFQEYSNQRAQFARVLQAQVERTGEEAADSGSVAGAVHRGWINLKSSMSSRDDIAVLEECERGEDSAVHAYSDALTTEDVGSARSIVEEQYSQIRAAHDHIRTLRDTMKQGR